MLGDERFKYESRSQNVFVATEELHGYFINYLYFCSKENKTFPCVSSSRFR